MNRTGHEPLRAGVARTAGRRFALTVLALATLAAGVARADTLYAGTPANYRRHLASLAPGDTLMLAAGEYRNGLPIVRLAGAPGRPITISGPAIGRPALFIGREGSNTISIVDAQHIILRNIVLDGVNLPVDGVKAEGHAHWAHDITLENLTIRGHGNNQQTVAISTKCPAWNWTIRGNTIEGAGTGMYLGNSDGSAPFVAGVIERNVLVNSIGYNLQIKHQNPRPEIPGLPREPSTTVIRDNVFVKSAGGDRDNARPNVLVGHFPLAGAGVDDQYVVYRNFFYDNPYEALLQGEGNVAIYDNLFVNRHGDAIRIQPHNDVPRRIDIAYNTVLAEATGISIIEKPERPALRLSIAANAVFAGAPIIGAAGVDNVTARLEEARRYLRRPFAPLGQLDLAPQRRWPNGRAHGVANPASFPDWDQDFDGQPRDAAAIGAYAMVGKAPRWMPRAGPKPK